MILNRFFINVLIRVSCIALTSVLLGIALQHLGQGYYYTISGIIFALVLQTYLLVNQVNKTNGDLEKFFSSVQDHDSSVRFRDRTGNSSFRKLHDSMNHLNSIIQ
jgi:NhaP-type Na+/H+ or K+/H+ antiporter